MNGVLLACESGNTRHEVRLDDYLDAPTAEQAATRALAWIKHLRMARVDGRTLRQRFTVRGDSLWWFAELYLHKQQVIAHLFRTIAALETLLAHQRPQTLHWVRGPALAREIVAGFADARRLG